MNGCDSLNIGYEHTNDELLKWKDRLKPYLIALRIWSFTVSVMPVALGSCLAGKSIKDFNISSFICVCLSVISVHAAGNLVNTYNDYKRGVDGKKSDDRTLVDKLFTPDDIVKLGSYCYLLGTLMFIVVVFISSTPSEHLALVYFGGLSGSFMYTGGFALKYIALGDIVVFLTFGPVTVVYAFLAQGGPLSWEPLLYALPLSLNACAILHSNNVRDRHSDQDAGIVTLAILLGNLGSYSFFMFLLFTPFIIVLFLALNIDKVFVLPLLSIFSALKYERLYRKDVLFQLPEKLASLNFQFGSLYVISCALSAPIFSDIL